MDIKYLGHSSFLFRSKTAKIVTDPFSPQSTGLKFPKIEADIVTISHNHADHNYQEGIKGEPLVITWPGEYEKNDVRITGYPTYHDGKEGAERGENVMYKFEINSLSVLHCGDLGHLLQENTADTIGEVDAICIPVGGVYTITPTEAIKVINEIGPRIIIPMHYQQTGLDPNIFAHLQPVSEFLKAIGAEDVQPVDKLNLKKELVAQAEQRVVVMSL